jgi:type IV secretion system protein TrbI
MADSIPGTASLTDHRTPPRGVLPRHTQTWLMVGLAVGILSIIVFTGRPPERRQGGGTNAATPAALNPERLRDYQDRLRGLDARLRQEAVSAEPQAVPAVRPAESRATAAAPDAMDADRKRRDYDSLFASNVVLSRRPDAQRLVGNESPMSGRTPYVAAPLRNQPPSPPTLDDVADAVVRATTHYAPSAERDTRAVAGRRSDETPSSGTAVASGVTTTGSAPLHRLLEGTIIDAVLTNRLEGSAAAPVNCLVTNAVYASDGDVVLIPAGARVLGQTKPVQAFGDTRLAVAFDRLMMPDGHTYSLEHFIGLNDIGDAGLRDQVDLHYRATFGASAAVGLLSGFAQFLAGSGFNRATGSSPVIVAGGASEATTQATAQTMNRFLNRPPTVTIREGHRVKVYLTGDLDLPAYRSAVETHQRLTGRLLGGSR